MYCQKKNYNNCIIESILRNSWGCKNTTKNWHVKTYLTHRSAIKISTIHSQHSLPFSSIKKLCTKNLNLTIHFRFQEKGKVKKVNNWNLHQDWINLPSGNYVLRNLMFWKSKSVTSLSWVNHSWYWIEVAFKRLLFGFCKWKSAIW